MFAAVWGSTLVVDGKVYLGDEDGDVTVLQAGKDEEGAGRDEHGQRRSTPRGALRTGCCSSNNRNQLFALCRQMPGNEDRRTRNSSDSGSFSGSVALRDRFVLRLLTAGLVVAQAHAGRTGPSSAATHGLTGVAPARAARYARPRMDRTKPVNRSNPPPRSSTARSTSARRRASCWRSISRPGSSAGAYATGEAGSSASRRRRSTPTPCSSAISPASCTRSIRQNGQKRWTFKTNDEIRSSPVLVDDLVLIGSHDTQPLRAREPHRQGALEAADRRPGPRDARQCTTASSISAAATSASTRCASADGKTAVRAAARLQRRPRPPCSKAIAPISGRSAPTCSPS